MHINFLGFLRHPHPGLHLSLNKGQQDVAEPVVIGGMVLDIHASSSMPINPRTTIPGKVRYALGGVARNVAECMSKFGTKPFMISALGLDMAGNLLLEHWRSSGLSVEGIQKHQDIETAVVCNIFDGKGEVAAGVASVEALEKFLTPKWIAKFRQKICSAPVLMVDANLSLPALVASCRMAAECETPVWFEPVSVAKSKRIASVVQYDNYYYLREPLDILKVLRQITFASPNEDELVAMANTLSHQDKYLPVQRDCGSTKLSTGALFLMLKPAIWVLLEKGIRVVIVTLGSDGVFLCCKQMHCFKKHDFMINKPRSFSRQLYDAVNSSCPPGRFNNSPPSTRNSSFFAVHFPALSAKVVRLTGAGDCLVGGTLSSFCAGLDIFQSVAVGIAAAKAAVEAETNVPAQYVSSKIADDARSVYFDSDVVFCESKL